MGAPKRHAATMGKPAGAVQPDPHQFTKSHARDVRLPSPKAPTQPKEKRNPPVPKRDEKPVMGLVSSKNFITTNAIEAILSQARNRPTEEARWTDRQGFGEVPKYLKRNKQALDAEKRRVEEYMALREEQELKDAGVVRSISREERDQILRHLKLKWASVNTAYQKMTFTLDTPAKQKRKEQYEAELSEIERDIRMLERGESILVVED